MKDYKSIISEIVSATEDIQDQKLKEVAFQSLLNSALSSQQPSVDLTSKEDDSRMPISSARFSPAGKKRSPSPAVRTSIVRDEVKKAFIDVTPNMPGVKPLSTLKQKWEKYIWVLGVGKEKGVEMMTNNEIAYILSENFSVGVTEKTVNNLTFKVEAGFVQKRDLDGTRAWKILIDGINFLKPEQTES